MHKQDVSCPGNVCTHGRPLGAPKLPNVWFKTQVFVSFMYKSASCIRSFHLSIQTCRFAVDQLNRPQALPSTCHVTTIHFIYQNFPMLVCLANGQISLYKASSKHLQYQIVKCSAQGPSSMPNTSTLVAASVYNHFM